MSFKILPVNKGRTTTTGYGILVRVWRSGEEITQREKRKEQLKCHLKRQEDHLPKRHPMKSIQLFNQKVLFLA